MIEAKKLLEAAADGVEVSWEPGLTSAVLDTTAALWLDYLNGCGVGIDIFESQDAAAMLMLHELAKITKRGDEEQANDDWMQLVKLAGAAWRERLRYEGGSWCQTAREAALKKESEGKDEV